MEGSAFRDLMLRRAAIGIIGISCVGIYFMGKDYIEESKLYPQTSIKADTNQDGRTDYKEWAKVYNNLGIHFDSYGSNPRIDLTPRQLEKYLSQFPNK